MTVCGAKAVAAGVETVVAGAGMVV